MHERGFSLIELLIVIALIAILLAIATIDFGTWSRKYQVERQTREMYADIMQARISALQRKQRVGIFFGPRQYVIRRYDTAEDTDGEVVLTINLQNEIRRVTGSGTQAFDIDTQAIEFDTRGLTAIGDQMQIAVMPLNVGSGGDNCIVVAVGRTNIGRMSDATTCTPR
jgi:type IV fimbrial biogenesis protein FimT